VRLLYKGAGGVNVQNNITFNKNGSGSYVGLTYYGIMNETALGGAIQAISPVLSVIAGDYFDVYCSAGSLSGDVTGTETWFAMEIIE
jgi:hypothetical protein